MSTIMGPTILHNRVFSQSHLIFDLRLYNLNQFKHGLLKSAKPEDDVMLGNTYEIPDQ